MTAHDFKTAIAADLLTRAPARAKHPLPAANLREFANDVVIFTPCAREMGRLLDRAGEDLVGLAKQDVVEQVFAHNPDSFWAIARRQNFSPSTPRGEGFVAFLFLNETGLSGLIRGTFDGSNPDPKLLCQQNERPAGIYLWCMHAKHGLAPGVPLAFEKMWTPLYAAADIFARAVTKDGQRFLEIMGFRRLPIYRGVQAPHLHILRRSQSVEELPLYDRFSGQGKDKDISVTVARSIEDIMRVVSIRSAVYIAEQECPYLEEFDDNDFCATHLLGYIGNEPAGCLRIRYFADFAKIERLAVRKEFRNTRLSFHIVRAGIELCRAKGYQVLYGHSQKRLLKFWGRFGFKPIEGAPEFVFSDFDYVEIRLDAQRSPQSITIGLDPYVMIRPEGRWHLPGILEKSAARPATRPSVTAEARE